MAKTTLVLLASLVGAPADAASQQVGPGEGPERETPEILRQRLDSLRPLVERARADLEARRARMEEIERRAAEAATAVDTLTIATATVLTPARQAHQTRELFESVWDERFASLGTSPSLARATLVFQWADEAVPIHTVGEASRLHLDTWTRRTRAQQAVRDLLATAMSHDLHEPRTEIGAWVRRNPLAEVDPEQVYRQLATTHSRATRACLDGQTSACISALGLGTERGARQLRTWYTPEERRSLVATRFDPRDRRYAGNRSRCLAASAVELCDDMLLTRPYLDWTPLGVSVRQSVTAYALERGGSGAWSRLIEDRAMSPAQALEYAAGVPLPELVAGWRARIVSHRPDSFEGLIPSSGRALAWTLFFAALALRSTRWRLG